MQSKVLRMIFPERPKAASSSELLAPVASAPGPEQAQDLEAPNTVSRTFSQLASSNGASSAVAESGNTSQASSTLPDSLSALSKQLDQLRTVTESQVSEIGVNTAALTTNTAAKSVSQAVESAGKAASGFLGVLTGSPLISGILSLFGAGSGSGGTQPALKKYTAPPAVSFDEAVQSGSSGSYTQQVRYDQFGRSQANPFEGAAVPDYSSFVAATPSGIAPFPGNNAGVIGSVQDSETRSALAVANPATNQVTVNIQAMDSQSFLDRSQDIAQAVREAMLNMHSINDVVNDL